MEITFPDLLKHIGSLYVENQRLRQQLAERAQDTKQSADA